MAFTSDSQGFLVGETITEIKRTGDILSAIRNDISAIKKAVVKGANSSVDNSQNTGSMAQQPAQRNRVNVGNTGNQNGANRTINRDALGRFVSARDNTAVTPGRNTPSAPTSLLSNNQVASVIPSAPVRLRDESGRFRSTQQSNTEVSVPIRQNRSIPVQNSVQNVEPSPVNENMRTEPRVRRVSAVTDSQTPAIPVSRTRDRSGRFASNTESSRGSTDNSGQSGNDAHKQRVLFDGLGDRIASAVTETRGGLEEIDPTVKAFNEVAEPLSRGYKLLVGDKGHSGESGWLRKIFSILKISRTDNTTFDRAARRSLGHIEDNTAGGSDGGDEGFTGGVMGGLAGKIMAVFAGLGTTIVASIGGVLSGLGSMLLTGITSVLGVVFSPIGLAIAAAGAIAWGLFTENGQKFFGEVGAKLIEGWNVVTTAFAPVSDAIKAGWEVVTAKFEPIAKSIGESWDTVKTGFDDLINGMESGWNAFTGFLKDKFGIDVHAILKPIADAGKKAVEGVKTGIENVKEGAKTVVNKVADKTKSSTDKVSEKASALGEKANTYVKEKTGVDVKEHVSSAVGKVKEGASTVAGKVTEGISTVARKAEIGASNIKSHATGKSATNKAAMEAEMEAQGITDPKEKAMLMAQVDHESGGFAYTKELGKDSYFDQYDAGTKKGARLGNTEKGDGAKYKGRGLIQLTGKSNYAAASKDLGVDLVNHPDLAETPEMAAKTAVWYWKKNNLGNIAKTGDVKKVTKRVNGGYNGLADREEKYNKYLADNERKEQVASAGQEQKPISNTLESKPIQTAAISNSVTAQAVTAQPAIAKSAPSPVLPEAPKPPIAVADATPVMEPLASLGDRKGISVSVEKGDVGQDLSDRRLAHISTGGLSGKG